MRAASVQNLRAEIFQRQHILDVFVFDRKLPAGRHHSDDRMRPRRDLDLLADDFGIAAERTFPKRIGQDYDAVGFIPGVFFCETTSEQWLHAQDLKHFRRDCDALEIFRVLTVTQCSGCPRVRRHRRNAPALVAEIGVVRIRMDVAAHRPAVICISAPDHHDLIWVFEWKRAQKNGIDHAEDRAVGANAERKREDGDDGEDRRFDQHPESVFQVG